MPSPRISTVFFDLGKTLVQSATDWVPGAQDLLTSLQNAGVHLGIISNTGQLTRAEILQLLPTDFDLGIFDPNLVLFSSEVGVEKPTAAIFDLAVQHAGVVAARCLFCTEDLTDTLAAQCAGMAAARVREPPASDVATLLPALRAIRLID